MLPKALESKVKPYGIDLGDATVEVLDPFWSSESFLINKLTEFEKQLNPQRRIAGIGFKCFSSYCWLLLCAGTHCLFIKLSLKCVSAYRYRDDKMFGLKILTDPTICFVGMNIDTRSMDSKWIEYDTQLGFNMPKKINAFEIAHLVAKIHQEAALSTCGSLQKLATEVGLEIKPNITHKSIDWNAKVFSKEDIKFVVYDVYYSIRIADKLMYG